MSMFKNYPQPSDYIPDNRPKPIEPRRLEIMAGETTTHTFEVPFDVVNKTLKLQVLYKLGLNVILIKEDNDLNIFVKEDGTSVVSCHISDDESILFANTLLSTSVQMRFVMLDGSVQFTEIYRVKVRNSLDAAGQQPQPTPSIIKGIGYTED